MIYIYMYVFIYLVGGFNPSEKYESQLGWWHSQYMDSHKSHVPNHQPDMIWGWLTTIDPYHGDNDHGAMISWWYNGDIISP